MGNTESVLGNAEVCAEQLRCSEGEVPPEVEVPLAFCGGQIAVDTRAGEGEQEINVNEQAYFAQRPENGFQVCSMLEWRLSARRAGSCIVSSRYNSI